MEKTFKIQKISSKIYIFLAVAAFIYTLMFMTSFWKLAGYETLSNVLITEFYDGMQNFNFIQYYFAIAGLVSIAFLFAFDVMKKVCDKVALIVVSVFGGISAAGAAVALALMPSFVSKFANDDLLVNAHLEQNVDDMILKTKNFFTFYMGYALYGLLLVTVIVLIVSSVLSNRKFVKQMGGIENVG